MIISPKAMGYINSRGLDINDPRTNIPMESYDSYNSIFANYGIYKKSTMEDKVCVGDIKSTVMGGSSSLYFEFASLYNENNTSDYYKRDMDLLEYTPEELNSVLRSTFENEPVDLLKLSNNEYVINQNGRHRVNLLKINYLGEMQNCTFPEEINAIREKYSIPAKVHEIDKIKTLSNYILKKIDNEKFFLSNEYDSNYNKTGKTSLRVGKDKIVLSDEELLEFTRDELQKHPGTLDNLAIDSAYNKELKDFMSKYFTQIKGYEDFEKLQNRFIQGIEEQKRQTQEDVQQKTIKKDNIDDISI